MNKDDLKFRLINMILDYKVQINEASIPEFKEELEKDLLALEAMVEIVK